jgi:hypothetical protein
MYEKYKTRNPKEKAVKQPYRPVRDIYFQQPGSPGWPQQLFNLTILRREFFTTSRTFFPRGIGFLRFSMTAFTLGDGFEHIKYFPLPCYLVPFLSL